MQQVLVLGISGSFGGAVARALLQAGVQVKALVRSPERCPAEIRQKVTLVEGDAADPQQLLDAACGCDVLVYGVNVPYPQWQQRALPLLETSVRAAEQLGLRLVFPGNVYNFDPGEESLVSEEAAQHPVSRKGVLRVSMEQRLRQASEDGARVLIVRAGDYFGPDAGQAWLGVLLKQSRSGVRLSLPCRDQELVHSWAYLPDLADTVVRLLSREPDAPFEVFHFAGHRASFSQLRQALEAATGRPVAVGRFPWWLLRLGSPFVPLLKELLEMRYLWEQRLDLDDSKLRQVLPELKQTPLEEALLATLATAAGQNEASAS